MKLRSLGLCTLLASTVACGPTLPRAPTRLSEDPDFQRMEATAPAGLDDEGPTPFVLLPGDQVRLRTISLDPLDLDALPIDNEGALTVPFAGTVRVGGVPLQEAALRIETALRPFDRFARVVLSVTQPGGHRASVLGAVERPGAYPIMADVRVAELLALSGGVRTSVSEGEAVDLADLGAARVVRRGITLPISVQLAMQGDARHNVRVVPGDLVVVPPSRGQRVSVLGEVRAARSIPFRSGLRLTDAIAMAGGTNENADRGDVRVVRGPLSRPRIYRASLWALSNGQAHDVELAPGDVVMVTEHWFATASQVIQRLTPWLALAAVGVGLLR